MTEKKLDIDQRPLEMPPLRQSKNTKTDKVVRAIRTALDIRRMLTRPRKSVRLIDAILVVIRAIIRVFK